MQELTLPAPAAQFHCTYDQRQVIGPRVTDPCPPVVPARRLTGGSRSKDALRRNLTRNQPRLRRAVLVLLAVAALAFAPAFAAELKVIDSGEAPWPSIGRVNVAGYRSTSMCTGTLIAPRLVLTAAHCLYNKRTLRPFPTGDFRFMAGVRRDLYSARLTAACALHGAGFTPKKRPKLRDVRHDVGLIVLKEASTLPPVAVLTPAEAQALTRGTRFRSVGYRRSRRFLPTIVEDCGVIGTAEESWVTDCASEAGASGGPLLVETSGGLRVAGVMSARIDAARSAIVPFPNWQALLENATCDARGEQDAPIVLRPGREGRPPPGKHRPDPG